MVLTLIALFFVLKKFERFAKKKLTENPYHVHQVVQGLFFALAATCLAALFFAARITVHFYELIVFIVGMSIVVIASGFVVL